MTASQGRILDAQGRRMLNADGKRATDCHLPCGCLSADGAQWISSGIEFCPPNADLEWLVIPDRSPNGTFLVSYVGFPHGAGTCWWILEQASTGTMICYRSGQTHIVTVQKLSIFRRISDNWLGVALEYWAAGVYLGLFVCLGYPDECPGEYANLLTACATGDCIRAGYHGTVTLSNP